MMIDKQREKEFLFELERLYYHFNLVLAGPDDFQLFDLGDIEMPETALKIEMAIDRLKEER